jgi:hypothetical protein
LRLAWCREEVCYTTLLEGRRLAACLLQETIVLASSDLTREDYNHHYAKHHKDERQDADVRERKPETYPIEHGR